MMLAARIPNILHLQVVTLASGPRVLLVPSHWHVDASDLQEWITFLDSRSTKEQDPSSWMTREAISAALSGKPKPSIWNFVSQLMKKLRNLV